MTDFLAVESTAPLRLKPALTALHKKVANYRPPVGLREAADVAMLLGVPLLLTGEPGSGKTSAAAWLARELEAGDVLSHDVKSTTTGRDLLYSFDEVARFRDSSGGTRKPLIDYLQFNALGEAIIRAAGARAVLKAMDRQPLEGAVFEREDERLKSAFGKAIAGRKSATADLLLPHESDFAQAESAHRVVLIDELDKAPRDTPNDLLAEIDDMGFAIPELGVRVTAPRELRPVILITSNSEKALPEPFLRRCAYFNIPEASDRELEEIVVGAIGEGSGVLLTSAIALFRTVRTNPAVQKRPGTAELIACIHVLLKDPKVDSNGTIQQAYAKHLHRHERPETDAATKKAPPWAPIGALMKSDDDITLAMAALAE